MEPLSDEKLDRLVHAEPRINNAGWAEIHPVMLRRIITTIDSLRRTVELQGDVVSAAQNWRAARRVLAQAQGRGERPEPGELVHESLMFDAFIDALARLDAEPEGER